MKIHAKLQLLHAGRQGSVYEEMDSRRTNYSKIQSYSLTRWSHILTLQSKISSSNSAWTIALNNLHMWIGNRGNIWQVVCCLIKWDGNQPWLMALPLLFCCDKEAIRTLRMSESILYVFDIAVGCVDYIRFIWHFILNLSFLLLLTNAICIHLHINKRKIVC